MQSPENQTAPAANPGAESSRAAPPASARAVSPPVVCLMGTLLDVENMGCRALTWGAVTLFERFLPGCDLRLLQGNRVGGVREVELKEGMSVRVEVVNCRFSPKVILKEHVCCLLARAALFRLVPRRKAKSAVIRKSRFLESLNQARFVGEIFGGDSFSDIYGLSRFVFRAAPTVIAIWMGKRLVLLPQTYGPYRHWITRVIARYIIRRSVRAYARDRESLDTVEWLLGSQHAGVRLSFCPDVAFALGAIKPADAALAPLLTRREGEVLVGLNISGLLLMGGYTHDNMFGLKCDYGRFVRDLLKALLEVPGVQVLLVPHTFEADAESDLQSCREIYSELQASSGGRLALLDKEHDQNRLKYIIGQCDFFIGSRMHACIAALSQGVPAVGVAYSKKFKGVFESVGMGAMVADARELDTEGCVAACLQAFHHRDQVRATLAELLPGLRQSLFGCFEELVRDYVAPSEHEPRN